MNDYVAQLLAEAAVFLRPNAGCEDCPAEQELREIRPGLHLLEIKHDPTCPFYRALDTN